MDKREQIIKALKIYEDTISPSRCAVCAYAEMLKGTCEPLLFKETLSLINELTEENAELCREYDSMAKSVNEASDLIRSLKSRIRRLEAYDEQRDIALHARLIDETRAETAREIFEEIEKLIEPNGNYLWRWDLNKIAELKKKYAGGEK